MKLEAGQELYVKLSAHLTSEARQQMQRLRIPAQTTVFVTYVDEAGISLYIKRPDYGDIEGFIPTGGAGLFNWSSFF